MSGPATSRRSSVGLVVALLVAALLWWVQSGDDGTTRGLEPSSGASTTSAQQPGGPSRDAAVDPESGLPLVNVGDLPSEASHTLALIRTDGPFPYDEDGGTFGNYEGLLPEQQRGYYREYTVDTPGSEDRGARRIIQGGHGELYWTDDHYESFRRIRG